MADFWNRYGIKNTEDEEKDREKNNLSFWARYGQQAEETTAQTTMNEPEPDSFLGKLAQRGVTIELPEPEKKAEDKTAGGLSLLGGSDQAKKAATDLFTQKLGKTFTGQQTDNANRKIAAEDITDADRKEYKESLSKYRTQEEIQKDLDAANQELSDARKKWWRDEFLAWGGGIEGRTKTLEENDARNAEIKSRIADLEAEQRKRENAEKYEAIRYQPDFTEKAKAQELTTKDALMDPLYAYINGDKTAGMMLMDATDVIHGKETLVAEQMTPDEVKIYNYIHATEGKDAADAYVEFLRPELNERNMESVKDQVANLTDQNLGTKILGSAASVAMAPLRGLAYAGQALDYLTTGKVDPNAPYNMYSAIPSAARETVSNDIQRKWGKWGTFAYQTGLSMADFLLTAGVSGGSEALSLSIMGTGAAADATISAKERGLGDTEAFIIGTIAGAAEIASEKISFEKLFKNADLREAPVKYILQNFFFEGSEEVESDVINWLADAIVARDKSEWQADMDAYKAEHPKATDTEAFWDAVKQRAIEGGMDFLGGAISGGVMAGGAVTFTNAATGAQRRTDRSQNIEAVRAARNAQEAAQAKGTPEGAITLPTAADEMGAADDSRGASEIRMGTEPAPGLKTADEVELENKVAKAKNITEATGIKYGADKADIRAAEKYSRMTGMDVEFYSEGSKNGTAQNGYYDPSTNKIYYNVNAKEKFRFTFGHEFTHGLEGTRAYNALSDLVKTRIDEAGEDLDMMRAQIQDRYDRAGIKLTAEQVDQEIVADWIGNNLSDERTIREICRENASVGKQIRDALDSFITRAADMQGIVTKYEEEKYKNVVKAYDRYLGRNQEIEERNQVQPITNMQQEGVESVEEYLERMSGLYDAGEITEEQYQDAQAIAAEMESTGRGFESSTVERDKGPEGKIPAFLRNVRDRAAGRQYSVSEAEANTTEIIEKDPNSYPYDTQKVIKGYIDAVDADVLDYVNRINGNEKTPSMIKLGTVSEKLGAAVEAAVGINPVNGDNRLTADTVRHIERRHGTKGEQDHSMQHPEDIARIQYVLDNFDSVKSTERVTKADLNKDGTHARTVEISKKIDGTYYIIEAVPDAKNNRMTVVSAYIKNNRNTVDADAEAPGGTSETNATPVPATESRDTGSSAEAARNRQENSVNDIVSQPEEEVKGVYEKTEGNAEPAAVSPDGEVLTEELPGGTMVKYSLSSWNETDKDAVMKNLVKAGYSWTKARRYIENVNSIAAIIAGDRTRLDYNAAENQVYMKPNDEYEVTLDASTLCAKRLVYQGTFNKIQHELGNWILLPEDLIDLSNMMAEDGYQVPCGICYVESRRRHLGRYADEWLADYDGEYKPTLDEVTTTDGLERLRHEHPDTYQDFVSAMNAKGTANPKVVQLRTDYRGDINRLSKRKIEKIKRIGGVRIQSFSDFETPHLIDTMQAVLDMSAKELPAQAYTKVPNFAWVFGDTGIKINLSLIGGLDENGNLTFSSTEGMDFDEAMRLREKYSENVGTILVGMNDAHILAAMADPRIDFIIPFHKIGWSKTELDKMKSLNGFEDYTAYQNERLITGRGKKGEYTSQSLKDAKLDAIYPEDYWSYRVSGKRNAERYLKLCKEKGYLPKFYNFLVDNGDGSFSLQPDGSTDGYWKTLIDYKMYDNDGKGAPQRAVSPDFNMEEAERVLAEYQGGANELPSASDEFIQKYVDHYNEVHGGSEEDNIRYSIVDDPETLDFLENQDTVKVYRAMQMIDGELYPPMAAKVEGKFVEPTRIGEWYQADERPDLVKNGKFVLNKGNGSTVPAAYNPYFHSSASPLNDQFSSAYKRPNLVVVEGEIPSSELTSGYRAEGAKNAVGETSWHAGPVASKLKGEKARRVYLSRWFKVDRVMTDAEVADIVADTLQGENVTVPSNVVTPSLLEELRDRGVPISDVRYSVSDEEPLTLNNLTQKAQSYALRAENTLATAVAQALGVETIRTRDAYKTFRAEIIRPVIEAMLRGEDVYVDQFLADAGLSLTEAAAVRSDVEEALKRARGEIGRVRRSVNERAAEQEARERRNAEIDAQIPDDAEGRIKMANAFKDAKKRWTNARARTLMTDEDIETAHLLALGQISEEEANARSPYGYQDVIGMAEAERDYIRTQAPWERYTKRLAERRYEMADRDLENADRAKDKASGFQYARETPERNFRDVFGSDAGRLIDDYIRPIHKSEAISTRFKNDYIKRVKDLGLSQKVARGNQNSEATAVQFLGEAEDNVRYLEAMRRPDAVRDGQTLDEWRSAIEQFKAANPNLNYTKINEAISEFGKIYGELIEQMNTVLVDNGYMPVNIRRGYFPHFNGGSDGILSTFAHLLGINIESNALPTAINGLTSMFKPGKPWFSHAQERTGFQTDYDAIQGFDGYIGGVSDVIHQTKNIRNLRALSTRIRWMMGDEQIKRRIDEINADENRTEQEKLADIQELTKDGRYKLSQFVAWLDEYTNLLANKTSVLDRSIENLIGRKRYTRLKNLEGRVAANMISGNLGSALTNFIPLNQAGAMLGDYSMLRGAFDTMTGRARDDGFVNRSDFLTNRRGTDPLIQSKADKISEFLSSPMNLIDNFTSEVIVRAAYDKYVHQGMNPQSAMQAADEFAAGVMADRSKGATPTIFSSHNPLTKLLTQFQVEVNNEFSTIFKDIPKGVHIPDKEKKNMAAVAAWTMLRYFIGAYLFNDLYEKIVGRRAALDPIDILNDAVGDLTGAKLNNTFDMLTEGVIEREQPKNPSAALKNLRENITEELPFIGGLAGGGRIPISSALPDFEQIEKAASDANWSPEKKRQVIGRELGKTVGTYILPPFAGGLGKKIYQTAENTIKGGRFIKNAEGEDQMQYPYFTEASPEDVEKTEAFLGRFGLEDYAQQVSDTWQKVKTVGGSAAFGPTSTRGGYDWVEGGFGNQSAKNTSLYRRLTDDLGENEHTAWDFVSGLKGLDGKEEKSMAVVNSGMSDRGKAEAMETILNSGSSTDGTKFRAAYDNGVSADAWAWFYDTLKEYNTGSTNVTQEEARNALDNVRIPLSASEGATQSLYGGSNNERGLTNREKAVIWAAYRPDWKQANNPYDPDLGESVSNQYYRLKDENDE